jgi:hypothetical protein
VSELLHLQHQQESSQARAQPHARLQLNVGGVIGRLRRIWFASWSSPSACSGWTGFRSDATRFAHQAAATEANPEVQTHICCIRYGIDIREDGGSNRCKPGHRAGGVWHSAAGALRACAMTRRHVH